MLNLVLLVLVAIFPYLFDQAVSSLNPSSVQNYASILLTVDYAGTLLIMAVFAHVIAQEEAHLVDGEALTRFRKARIRLSSLTLIVLLSLAIPWDWLLVGIHVRLFISFIPIISFWFNRLTRTTSRPSGV